ncbi:kinesin-like protein [Microbotryomycetes sp. JL221]|nr:kinesin-like protein [Microbotryomycetes sp. JL221]
MSFGPGNAFGSFASSVAARAPRRINSSGSFKDPNSMANAANPSQQQQQQQQPSHMNGPTPVDHVAPPVWQDLRHREHSSNSNNGFSSSASNNNSGPSHNGGTASSFSAILNPASGYVNGSTRHNGTSSSNNNNNENADPLQKPFVYSRDFILSLYDPDKAGKRPLEMATHEVATSDIPTKPWALQDYRPGEEDLFATSIHPTTSRVRTNQHSNRLGTGSGGDPLTASTKDNLTKTAQTLDLGSLATLPRDRDRALAAGTPTRGTVTGSGPSLNGALQSPSDRSALGALAAGRRTRSGLGSGSAGTLGIVGGVLGGIGAAAVTSTGSARSSKKDEGTGGRWRRGESLDEHEDKRQSSFGSRRFPLSDTAGQEDSSQPGSPADNSWDSTHAGDDSILAPASDQAAVDINSATGGGIEAELTQHATSVLGSLALDSEDDPVVPRPSRQTQVQTLAADESSLRQSSATPPPPGFEQKPVENLWQYRDPSGQVHEFSAEMMHEWYTQSFFQMDLRVRRSNELEFETLENLIRRTGNIDSPFLTAPPQPRAQLPPPTAVSGWPSAPSPIGRTSSTPTIQRSVSGFQSDAAQSPFLATAQSPFGQHATPDLLTQQTQQQPQPAQQPTQQQAADAWGLPSVSQWDESVFRAALLGNASQMQQSPVSTSFQQAPQSAAELLRQLSQQAQGQQQQSQLGQAPAPMPASPFYNAVPSQHNVDPWSATMLQQQQQQQQQQYTPVQQPAVASTQPWQTIMGSSRTASLDVATPIGTSAISPIGPPQSSRPASAAHSPTITRAAAPASNPMQVPQRSSWESVPTTANSEAEAPAVSTLQKTNADAQPEQVESPEPVVAKDDGTASLEDDTAASPISATTTEAKTAASIAPWLKEEEKTVLSGPSLREIQEAEARESEKRKAAARAQAAQANLLAAQRLAALDASEQQQQLPITAGWASSPTSMAASKSAAGSAGAGAPWSKPGAAPASNGSVGKSLKEIQEEEQRRKKEQAAAQAAAQAQAAAALGHPVPAATNLAGGSSWTTIATRTPPKAASSASSATRSVIPGLPVSAVSARAASKLAANAAPAPSIRPAQPALSPVVRASTVPTPVASSTPPAAPSVAKPSVIRSVSVSASSATPQFDSENPPPPSADFMKWCRDSLKGLTVPMEEFIRMLLSFPLDASADVLEIISDSVYANSSTLDGRRFANEFASRRKLDAAARYPTLFKHLTNGTLSHASSGSAANGFTTVGASSGGKKASNMAEALKSQPVAKTPEWSVKVSSSTNKKKKAATNASGQTIPGLK